MPVDERGNILDPSDHRTVDIVRTNGVFQNRDGHQVFIHSDGRQVSVPPIPPADYDDYAYYDYDDAPGGMFFQSHNL